MAVDIEPLLVKIAELAPRFGRAREDLEAMVNRGRASDYKGVMQNARLVVEMLLRSMVTEELKQTPGKAMLDELVTKFRQQANAGIIPTNILAHIGTVQAWGNLSSHDHAGGLTDAGVKVGREEVVASLNSVLAILSWYAEKKGLSGTPAAATPAIAPASSAALAPVKSSSKTPVFLGAAVLVLGVVGGVAAFTGGGTTPTEPPKPPGPTTIGGPAKVDPFATLDTVYGTWKEPVPPPTCRRPEDAAQLAKVVNDVQALSLVERPTAEALYLLARATNEQLKKTSPALEQALSCPGFAAAQHLAGRIAVREGRLTDAQKYYEAARASAPQWVDNRADLAGLLVTTNQHDAAWPEVESLITAAPDDPVAYLLRGVLKDAKGDKPGAAMDLCRATKLGSNKARSMVESASIQCP